MVTKAPWPKDSQSIKGRCMAKSSRHEGTPGKVQSTFDLGVPSRLCVLVAFGEFITYQV